jgi:hypothetical protein
MVNEPSSTAEHLHHLQVGILLQSCILPRDSIFYDYQVAWQIDTHGKGRGTAYDTQVPVEISILDGRPVM